MSETNRELIIPPQAASSDGGREILRAWVVEQSLHCSLRPTAWDDPSAWGVVLADVAKHVANALHEERGASVEDTLDSIRYMFNAEMLNPTDEAQGDFA
jgi:hypothetical protein